MLALEAKNITKTYSTNTALNSVSISVPEKSIFGLLGPNGAGKTSLIRIINQITGPDEGSIKLFGDKLEARHIEDIGYLPEERGLYKKMKVSEQALYLARLKGMSKQEATSKLKLWFERLEVENWWNKKVEELSKGMAQKIQFITTVLHEPKLLILDEPFSGFDPINAALIRKEILRLNQEGATIILSTHNMASVEEICDRIALIDRSEKILEGPIDEIKDSHRTHTYEVKFKGSALDLANALWVNFELVEKKIEGDDITAQIRLLNGKSPNDLLSSILPHVQIQSMREIIPSMNDIFIQTIAARNGEKAGGSDE